jgi:hypothetical protein
VKKLSTVILLFVLTITTAFSPDFNGQTFDTTAKIKAVYVYNFTKYIEWPIAAQEGKFTIGILGNYEPLFNELDNMSKVKKVANRSFTINSFSTSGEIKEPHILYIPKENSSSLSSVISKLKGKNTLIVTESPGLAEKGSAINFIVVGNRQKFELNKSTVTKYNLKVASALEKLAVLVN